jgi:hypothetical protein
MYKKHKTMKTREILMYCLGAVILSGFFGLLYILACRPIAVVNKDILMIAAGALIASFQAVVQYFYGSSKGSADKTEMLNINKS